MMYLCPIFSNFNMSDLENKISNNNRKRHIYLIYVDDILILANGINEINIQDTFQKNSGINFTSRPTPAILASLDQSTLGQWFI